MADSQVFQGTAAGPVGEGVQVDVVVHGQRSRVPDGPDGRVPQREPLAVDAVGALRRVGDEPRLDGLRAEVPGGALERGERGEVLVVDLARAVDGDLGVAADRALRHARGTGDRGVGLRSAGDGRRVQRVERVAAVRRLVPDAPLGPFPTGRCRRTCRSGRPGCQAHRSCEPGRPRWGRRRRERPRRTRAGGEARPLLERRPRTEGRWRSQRRPRRTGHSWGALWLPTAPSFGSCERHPTSSRERAEPGCQPGRPLWTSHLTSQSEAGRSAAGPPGPCSPARYPTPRTVWIRPSCSGPSLARSLRTWTSTVLVPP
jgi:hypothetical protein